VFAPVLRESTPHLYLSAMPQTPSSSSLCKLWVDHLLKHASVTSGHPASWPAEVHTLHGHTDDVNSVAYSPDGTHIVSGSEDNTIRVWNAITGQSVAGPFQGHTNVVTSVAYSPDGTHIVSGSKDNTIRIWNAITGWSMAGPFQGHTDYVSSVSYSPDGTHIVSGSWDNTIRVWNATTGQSVADPFQGHTSVVTSASYLPDGTHIVSGSWDNTIRVWNATTGQSVAGPFQGHTDYVSSVAYSPDGTHIVTGSRDNSIKVWRAQKLVSFGDLYEENSWIQSSNDTYFGWIAPWNRTTFHLPCHSLVIFSDRIVQLDIDSSLFGESWNSCWN
jgi:WD40 repeat protein